MRELGLPCLQPVSKLTLFFVVGEQPGDISGERKAERGAGNVIAKPSWKVGRRCNPPCMVTTQL